jgi:hypothetical protein
MAEKAQAVGSVAGIKGWQQLIGMVTLSASIFTLAYKVGTLAFQAGRAMQQHEQILSNEALILKMLTK